jgi:hypothetical protein
VAAAVPDTRAGRVTLHLNKASGNRKKLMTVRVARFIVELTQQLAGRARVDAGTL